MYKSVITLLLLVTITIWGAVLTYPDDRLHLIACDVGQGDAILITYKHVQVLTDGGQNKKVLDCLAKYVPFWDRTLDVVILTNPDMDHYGGLGDVFKNYQVKNYIKSPVADSTQNYQVLEDLVGSKDVNTFTPDDTTSVRYGLMYLDLVYPNSSLTYGFPQPQNNYSTVTLLRFGEFEALLTGDIEEEASDYLADNIGLGDIDYLKVPHHGSKNGITPRLLQKITPEIAVISAGKDNRYGHPHPEILKMLTDLAIKTLRTDEIGNIEISVDSTGWRAK